MPRHLTFTDEDRGTTIRVVKGKYEGRTGWLHKGYDETDCKVYVILSASGRRNAEVKQVYKESIAYGYEEEPKMWEEVLLRNKKVSPHYKTFLNKLLEAEYQPSVETLALIYVEWCREYEARQRQNRSRGFIRVCTPWSSRSEWQYKHPDKRDNKKKDTYFGDAFGEVIKLYVD